MVLIAFRPPRPVECGAYSSGVNGKQKIRNLSVLCASAVNYYEKRYSRRWLAVSENSASRCISVVNNSWDFILSITAYHKIGFGMIRKVNYHPSKGWLEW